MKPETAVEDFTRLQNKFFLTDGKHWKGHSLLRDTSDFTSPCRNALSSEHLWMSEPPERKTEDELVSKNSVRVQYTHTHVCFTSHCVMKTVTMFISNQWFQICLRGLSHKARRVTAAIEIIHLPCKKIHVLDKLLGEKSCHSCWCERVRAEQKILLSWQTQLSTTASW